MFILTLLVLADRDTVMNFKWSCVTSQWVLVVLWCLVAYCSGCFVRNCPPGGKRSMETVPEIHTQRQVIKPHTPTKFFHTQCVLAQL